MNNVILKLKGVLERWIKNIYCHCDYPLQDRMECGPDITIVGWAMSSTGIHRIEIYCDNVFWGLLIMELHVPMFKRGILL